jgi:pimeloyl-ACP methyl ester carboxylesterase
MSNAMDDMALPQSGGLGVTGSDQLSGNLVPDDPGVAKSATAKQSCPQYRLTGDGPLLVYVGGLDGTGQLLFKQMPELAKSYRVATFQLRDRGAFSYGDLAADVAAIIEDAGEDRATVLGVSFGGTVALWFALLYPNMLTRLVIINSFPRFGNRLKIKLSRRLASVLPFGMTWVLRASGFALGLYADGVGREDRRRCLAIISGVQREGYVRRLELIEQLDVVDRLKEISAPTLFIAADRDLLLPSVKAARLMASKVPNSRLEIVRGAGHACILGSRISLAEVLLKLDEGG